MRAQIQYTLSEATLWNMERPSKRLYDNFITSHYRIQFELIIHVEAQITNTRLGNERRFASKRAASDVTLSLNRFLKSAAGLT